MHHQSESMHHSSRLDRNDKPKCARAPALVLHDIQVTSICEWRIVTKTRKSKRMVKDHRSFKPCALARAPYQHDVSGARSVHRIEWEKKGILITRVTSFRPNEETIPQRFGRAVIWPASSTCLFYIILRTEKNREEALADRCRAMSRAIFSRCRMPEWGTWERKLLHVFCRNQVDGLRVR